VENVKSKSLCGPFLNCHPWIRKGLSSS
jgi:hypothetical protein